MNILDIVPLLTTPTLLEFHTLIAGCLAKDDAQSPPNGKKFEVRNFQDWKQWCDVIEKELRTRNVPFPPIKW